MRTCAQSLNASSSSTTGKGTNMTTAARNALLVLATGLLAASCMTQRDVRDYVQTNVVEKSLFEGEWYHAHTVVDNDRESMSNM